jgi:porin
MTRHGAFPRRPSVFPGHRDRDGFTMFEVQTPCRAPRRPGPVLSRPSLIAACVALAAAGAVCGQPEQEQEAAAGTGDTRDFFRGAADNVLNNLSAARFDRASMTELDPFTWLRNEMQKLNTELDRAAKLRIGFAWTALYQHASWTRTGDDDASSADFDFFGRWRPLQTRKTLGYVIFHTQVRYRLGQDITPRELGEQIGSLWGTVNGFNTQSFNLRQLYWQQFLFNNELSYRVGKVDLGDIFNNNRLESDNHFFLNAAFSDNLTMAYPDNNFGFDVIWRPDRLVYFAVGAADASGDFNDEQDEKSLKDADWFTVAEVGLTPWLENLGGGHYRLTGWYTEADEVAGTSSASGVSLSCDQDLGPRMLAFLRYGYTDGDLTATEQILAGGLAFRRPFGKNDDLAGIAAAWGRPTDDRLGDQAVVEAFYRFQVTPAIEVTPDLQLIIDPSLAPEEDYVWVFGVRVRITF